MSGAVHAENHNLGDSGEIADLAGGLNFVPNRRADV
jgi:hypothetical protein